MAWFWRKKSVEDEMRRVETDAHRWVCRPEQIAAQFDAKDLKGWLGKKLIVDFGTDAVVLQKAQPVATLGPGVYTVDSFLRRVREFDFGTPTKVLLTRRSDIELKFHFSDLVSADSLPITCAAYVFIEIKKPEQFLVNALGDRGALLRSDLEDLLAKELKGVLIGVVKGKRAEDLLGSLAMRAELNETLARELDTTLERLGLNLVQLRVLDFRCDRMQDVRQQASEVELYDKRVRLNSRLRSLWTDERVSHWSSERDFEEFIKQAEHEADAKGLLRREEIEELKRTFAMNTLNHELARKQVMATADKDLEFDLEQARARHQIELGLHSEELLNINLRKQQLEFEQKLALQRIEEVQSSELELERRKTEIEGDLEDLRLAREAQNLSMEMRKVKIEQDLMVERERMRMRLEEEEARAARELNDHQAVIELLKSQPDMSTDKLMAIGALRNPELARALVEKAKVDGGLAEERIAMYKETQEKLERTYKEFMEHLAGQQRSALDALRDRGGASVVVAGPGGGAASEGGKLLCPKCQTDNPRDSNFCYKCGNKLR